MYLVVFSDNTNVVWLLSKNFKVTFPDERMFLDVPYIEGGDEEPLLELSPVYMAIYHTVYCITNEYLSK